MNPQNCGHHIVGHHSHLWRKSMFIEPRVPDSQLCHRQLNQFSTTMNSSWRSRNNEIKTKYGHLSNTRSLLRQKSNVDDVLKEEKAHSQAKKTMIKSLLIDKKALEKSEMLVEGMKKLKQMDLLTAKGLQKMKLPGVIRHEKVYNDYHERSTNPGYSRNYQGKFYTK